MMRHSSRWIVFVIALLVALYVFIFARVGETQRTLLPEQEIRFSTGQTVLVEVADQLDEQILGLSFRESLEAGRWMLFVYDEKEEQLFWMKDMKFAIDIVWIDQGEIVGIEHRVPPPEDPGAIPTIYPSPRPVDMVLEVPAGYMEEQGIGIGTTISY